MFRPLDSLVIPSGCSFILTARGREFLAAPHHKTIALRKEAGAEGLAPRPYWDFGRRQLRWLDLLIKEFRSPAANQMAILAVLEKEGWPVRIDDPLPGSHGQDAKVRLHDTIKGLNRHQLVSLLRFRGDGTGNGVMWEWCEPVAPSAEVPGADITPEDR